MDENTEKQPENSENPPKIDWEWEYLKLGNRVNDIIGMINDLKAKDRSLSARISRLRQELKDYPSDDETDWEQADSARPINQTFPANLNLHELDVEQLQRIFSR